MARALEAGIAGARLVVLPGCGHVPNLDDPTLYNETTLAFLNLARLWERFAHLAHRSHNSRGTCCRTTACELRRGRVFVIKRIDCLNLLIAYRCCESSQIEHLRV